MDYRLTIDRGNTALKGAVWDNRGKLLIADSAVGFTSAGELARHLASGLLDKGEHFANAIYSSVVPSHRHEDIKTLKYLCPNLLELTRTTPLPIAIEYETPETLGADRVAAAVGASSLYPKQNLLVADVGTAVTYDFLSEKGVFCGGNIAPGIHMRLEALHAFTDRLPQVESLGPTPPWGLTTAQAMRSGAFRGIAAELEYYSRQAGNNATAVLTGGSVPLLIRNGMLNIKYHHDPYLVHRGLHCIIHYNENK